MRQAKQKRSYEAVPTEYKDIVSLRNLYRQEMNCQIVHDSHHARGFNRPFLLLSGGEVAGYGSVGDYDSQGRDVVMEFYVTVIHRAQCLSLFRALIVAGEVTEIQAQTNDRLLLLALYDFCRPESIVCKNVLFEDAHQTCLHTPQGVSVRLIATNEPLESIQYGRMEAEAELEGQVVGTGGFYCHYNPPYGDVYMDVSETYRKRGIGSYLVQEIKRACYAAGHKPSARCNADNEASRRTLEKAGFLACARILRGNVLTR